MRDLGICFTMTPSFYKRIRAITFVGFSLFAITNLEPGQHTKHVTGKALFSYLGERWSSLNGEKFKLFDDLWKLNLITHIWEKIDVPGGPSARSGHRMVCIADQLVIYGGLASEKYLSDLHVYDLAKRKWMGKAVQVAQSKSKDPTPGPRSGFAMWSHQANAFLWGGTRQKGRGGTEILDDLWTLDTSTFLWSKLTCPNGPSARSGVALAACDARACAFLFGGVSDPEEPVAGKKSSAAAAAAAAVFLSDLWCFSCDAREWRRIPLREGAHGPCGRRNAQMVVAGGALVLVGGLVEVREKGSKEKEVTLDDVWRMDLGCLDKGDAAEAAWECVVKRTGAGGVWHDSDSSGSDSEVEEDSGE